MQGVFQAIRSHGCIIKNVVLQRVRVVNPVMRPILLSRFESLSSTRLEEQGFESTTISDILKAKGKNADASWLWCTTEESVSDAVKSMTQHNVGALAVVNVENKLITVTSDTKVLHAMQLMTDNRIRRIPVIDNDRGMIAMVSIGDVVRAVVSDYHEELNRLNAYIQGGY